MRNGRDAAATQNYFQISTQNGPFTNPLARKAVIEAINVKSIIKNVLNNAVTYDIGPIVPSVSLVRWVRITVRPAVV